MNKPKTEDRRITLLRACKNLLQKQANSHFVLNLLNESVTSNDEEFSGYSLLEEIETALEIEDYFE